MRPTEIFWCLTLPFASSSPSSPHHPFFHPSSCYSLLWMTARTVTNQRPSRCTHRISTALDTAVLEASSHATDGNTLSFKSAEYERVFSSVKKMATAERNRLSADIIQGQWFHRMEKKKKKKKEEEEEEEEEHYCGQATSVFL